MAENKQYQTNASWVLHLNLLSFSPDMNLQGRTKQIHPDSFSIYRLLHTYIHGGVQTQTLGKLHDTLSQCHFTPISSDMI